MIVNFKCDFDASNHLDDCFIMERELNKQDFGDWWIKRYDSLGFGVKACFFFLMILVAYKCFRLSFGVGLM